MRVEARGLRAVRLILRVAAGGFAAVFVWLNLTTSLALHLGGVWLLSDVLIPVLVLTGVELGLEEYFSNRWIEIREDGILAVYRFHRKLAPWSRLTPDTYVIVDQTGFLFDRGRGRSTSLVLTLDQMRAVLGSPYAPKWSLNAQFARKLGVF